MRWIIGLTLAAFSVFLSGAVSAAPISKAISWQHGEKQFEGFLVYDDSISSKRPGLLMVPNWYGVNERALEKAKTLAGRDYVILLVDMYGRDVRPKNPEEAGVAAKAVYADVGEMRGRINKALAVLNDAAKSTPLDTKNIGAIGFCFGGATVLELARSGAAIAGVASFHGNLSTKQAATADAIKSSILAMNGADDTFVSAEQIAGFQTEMTAANADWQFVNYSGAVHCFAEPDEDGSVIPGCKYHAPSYRRSLALMRSFFAERFAHGQTH